MSPLTHLVPLKRKKFIYLSTLYKLTLDMYDCILFVVLFMAPYGYANVINQQHNGALEEVKETQVEIIHKLKVLDEQMSNYELANSEVLSYLLKTNDEKASLQAKLLQGLVSMIIDYISHTYLIFSNFL